jgi:hypothetical protein
MIEKGKIVADGNPMKVANEYQKLFIEKTGQKQANEDNKRYGTGEIMFENIRHEITKKELIVSLDMVNNTDKEFNRKIDFSLDIYSEGALVIGTNYKKLNKGGFSLNSKETKHLVLTLPNSFGNHDYDVSMNIRADDSMTVCDFIEDAFTFNNPYSDSKFYKVLAYIKYEEIK